jgi:hypothetical protein
MAASGEPIELRVPMERTESDDKNLAHASKKRWANYPIAWQPKLFQIAAGLLRAFVAFQLNFGGDRLVMREGTFKGSDGL